MAEEEILERSSRGISLEELVNSTTHGSVCHYLAVLYAVILATKT
jgi:hypothetical protein